MSCFVRDHTKCIASTISASLTVTIVSTCSAITANVRGDKSGEQPVGDRRGWVRRDEVTGRERSGRVVGRERLTADDAQRGPSAVDGERGAGEQPAAADRRDDRVEPGDLLDELERRGARTGDHVVVVERMDLDRAGLGEHARDRRYARLERRFAQHDRGTVRVDRGALAARRGRRHDDVRGDAARPVRPAPTRRRDCPKSVRRRPDRPARPRATAPRWSHPDT